MRPSIVYYYFTLASSTILDEDKVITPGDRKFKAKSHLFGRCECRYLGSGRLYLLVPTTGSTENWFHIKYQVVTHELWKTGINMNDKTHKKY